MNNWRVLIEKDVDVAYGLAVDEMLVYSVAYNGSVPILHLYNFLPSVIVGRYQNIQAAINLNECRRRGIPYNRRHTGGGTVLMGPEQLALGFAIPLSHPKIEGNIKKFFQLLGKIVSKALAKMGITSSFCSKNDIEVKGKKIAGLAVSREEGGVFFFHMSLLVDFDIQLMLKLLNIPVEKNTDRGMSCFSRRLTTIKNELGVFVPLPQVMELIEETFSQEFEVEFVHSSLSFWEKKKIQELIQHRYSREEWIFSIKRPSAGVCIQKKTPGGLLQIYLSLSKGVIEDILISGDFFSAPENISRLESALKWTPTKRESIERVLNRVMKDNESIYGVSVSALTQVIMEGIKKCSFNKRKVRNICA